MNAQTQKTDQKGRLTLDHEIQTYVPQFPKKQWAVTPRQ